MYRIGDCRELIPTLASESIDCIVTSPPYWKIRQYLGGGAEIGQEDRVQDFVDELVAVFRLCRRVLTMTGTLWVNIGDTYGRDRACGYKQLTGVPWLFAHSMQRDGWICRADIIWYKPNPTPAVFADRPTVAHEHVFLFTRINAGYYYDPYACRIPAAGEGTKAVSTVWSINTERFDGNHFSTFPRDLARRCTLLGCPLHVCRGCGSPWRRTVERTLANPGTRRSNGNKQRRLGFQHRITASFRTTAWRLDCPCDSISRRRGRVLDPFLGSGTTAEVAISQGLDWVGFEADPEQAQNIRRRTSQLSLWRT